MQLLLWPARPSTCHLSGERVELTSHEEGAGEQAYLRLSCRQLTQVEFSINNQTVTHGVLIDSGADESLMDWSLARQNQVKTIPLTHPVTASALDGRRLFRVTHCTEPIQIPTTESQDKKNKDIGTSFVESIHRLLTSSATGKPDVNLSDVPWNKSGYFQDCLLHSNSLNSVELFSRGRLQPYKCLFDEWRLASEKKINFSLFPTECSNRLSVYATTNRLNVCSINTAQVGFGCELFVGGAVFSPSRGTLLSNGRLTLPRQLCNYGVQACGKKSADKQTVCFHQERRR
ncbi:hypothetical protein FSCOSCO3_A016615 [Scomber scombrus]|uniref:Peptidase A2 domain-containing protein n=1 Tax=Scomber scombrus TaxID=13677 RepID=A0AAV1MRP6_SCOSC